MGSTLPLRLTYSSSICIFDRLAAYVVELHLSIFKKQLSYSEIDSQLGSMTTSLGYFVEDFFQNRAQCLFGSITYLCERRLAHLNLLHFLTSKVTYYLRERIEVVVSIFLVEYFTRI